MEEVADRTKPTKGRIKKAGFYAILFLSGVLISAFAREGLDAVRQTANIAAQTAGEAWSPSSGQKVIAKIPLSGATAQTRTANNIKKPQSTVSQKPASGAEIKKEEIANAEAGVSNKITSTTEPSSAATITNLPAPQTFPPINEQTSPTQAPPAPAPSSPSAPPPLPAPISELGHLVIAEIQISGMDGDNEKDFIRIGNPNSQPVDISGWKLRKRTRTGTESSIRVIPDGIIIPSGGIILWANSKNNFAVNMGAQIVSSATISASNSVALFDAEGSLVDAVAWGSGAGQFAEGSAFSENPGDGQILKRKTQNGTWQDTQNNAADFSV